MSKYQPDPITIRRQWPTEPDADLLEILGIKFKALDIAKLFRAYGVPIPHKFEAEQAYAIHWLLGLWFEHGSEWRVLGQRQIDKMLEELGAVKAATVKEAQDVVDPA